jgi:gliding motility-associated-like protein
MHLSESFDICSKSVSLSWNGYVYWPVSPAYEILRSVNGGAEVLIGTSNTTSFTDTSLINGSNLCYRVRAIDQSSVTRRTSTSNMVCMVPAFPPPPAFSYIRKVTVTSSSNVFIEAFVDPFAIVSGYQLLRSNSAFGPFTKISTVIASGVSTVTFNDAVDAANGPFYYKVQTIDSCGIISKDSQISHTILLNGNANSDYSNSLQWKHYGDWLGNVDHYNIYRRLNGVLSPLPLASFFPGDSTYLDEVLNEYSSDGNFCYVVEAIEGGSNPYFFLDSSRSNEVCLVQEPIVFMPNAFHPGGGLNDIYYPSNAFVGAEEYTFRVFNRWGELIFESTNPSEGWDGSSHGISAPEAVYVYLLRARRPDGTFIEKKGSLTLIR